MVIFSKCFCIICLVDELMLTLKTPDDVFPGNFGLLIWQLLQGDEDIVILPSLAHFLCHFVTLSFINILIELVELLTLHGLMNCLRRLREMSGLADPVGPKPSVLTPELTYWEGRQERLSKAFLLFIKSHIGSLRCMRDCACVCASWAWPQFTRCLFLAKVIDVLLACAEFQA